MVPSSPDSFGKCRQWNSGRYLNSLQSVFITKCGKKTSHTLFWPFWKRLLQSVTSRKILKFQNNLKGKGFWTKRSWADFKGRVGCDLGWNYEFYFSINCFFFRICFKHFDYDVCKFGATISLLVCSMLIHTFGTLEV